jgi:hypothetical protein
VAAQGHPLPEPLDQKGVLAEDGGAQVVEDQRLHAGQRPAVGRRFTQPHQAAIGVDLHQQRWPGGHVVDGIGHGNGHVVVQFERGNIGNLHG